MGSFSLDGLILLTGCRDSFFMLHVQRGSLRKWFLSLTVYVFSYNYIENDFTSKMSRMTTDERNSRLANHLCRYIITEILAMF